uniref:Secreted protein n=1 Tax=Romanomermis culicivorax TaxID=13658 RepID=A0A915IIF2_ROMCU
MLGTPLCIFSLLPDLLFLLKRLFFALIFVLSCGPDVLICVVTRKGVGVIADYDYFVLLFVRRVRVMFESQHSLRIYVAPF